MKIFFKKDQIQLLRKDQVQLQNKKIRAVATISIFMLFTACASTNKVLYIEPPSPALVNKEIVKAPLANIKPSDLDEENYIQSIVEIENMKQNGQVEQALKKANRAIDKFPQKNRLYLMKGTLLVELGEYQMAINNYKLALQKGATNTDEIETAIEKLNAKKGE